MNHILLLNTLALSLPKVGFGKATGFARRRRRKSLEDLSLMAYLALPTRYLRLISYPLTDMLRLNVNPRHPRGKFYIKREYIARSGRRSLKRRRRFGSNLDHLRPRRRPLIRRVHSNRNNFALSARTVAGKTLILKRGGGSPRGRTAQYTKDNAVKYLVKRFKKYRSRVEFVGGNRQLFVTLAKKYRKARSFTRLMPTPHNGVRTRSPRRI